MTTMLMKKFSVAIQMYGTTNMRWKNYLNFIHVHSIFLEKG